MVWMKELQNRVKTENRREWIDFIKGVSAMMVVLTHMQNTPYIYGVGYSFFMIPIFFFCSGYLCRFDEGAFFFLYNRVLKLLIVYIIYSILPLFTTVSILRDVIHSEVSINTLLFNILKNILNGSNWFLACLIIVSLLFVLIKELARENEKTLVVLSFILALIGVCISKSGNQLKWSINTALVCQSFYVAGFVCRKRAIPEKLPKKWSYYIFITIIYLLLISVATMIWGAQKIRIGVAINKWGILYITIPAIFLGCTSLLYLGYMLNRVNLINYIGRHSLVYFMFGSHSVSLVNKAVNVIVKYKSISFLINEYFMAPVICILGCIIMVVPCIFIDIYVPLLNGQFSMPTLKRPE